MNWRHPEQAQTPQILGLTSLRGEISHRAANRPAFHLGCSGPRPNYCHGVRRGKASLSGFPPDHLSWLPWPSGACKGMFGFFSPDHTLGMRSFVPLCDPVPEIWWKNFRETNGDYMEINHAQLVFSAGNCSILFPFHFSPRSLGSTPIRAWHQLELCD